MFSFVILKLNLSSFFFFLFRMRAVHDSRSHSYLVMVYWTQLFKGRGLPKVKC